MLRRALAGVTACATALLAAMAAQVAGSQAVASGLRPGQRAAAKPVSATPAAGTPQLAQTGDTTERVRQLVQCGSTMFAVGSFTRIEWSGRFYGRSNVFSFSAEPPYRVNGWDPGVNGVINSISFNDRDCAHAYIGGKFTSVDGSAARNIAEISTSADSLISAFAHDASGQVETLISHGGHLIAGGFYTSIGGSGADPYMTSLSPVTGRDDGYLHLQISGNYQFPYAAPNATRVYNQQVSPGGTLDLVEGDFTSVGGQPRQQVFMLRFGPAKAALTGWTSAEFDQHCVTDHPFYVQAGAWAPNNSAVYLVSTGFHPADGPLSGPRTGLCDSAAAFPATWKPVQHTWINYTGCWSLYSAAASSAVVYIGGHEEYADNPDACKAAGPGAVPASGLAGLNTVSGLALLNARGKAGLYYRSRGTGADDMLLTHAGLWIASDNGVFADGTFHLSDTCGNAHDHAGICFLPYS